MDLKWVCSHANCLLCSAGNFRPESPFIPLMADRIPPRLEGILESVITNDIESERIITVDDAST